MLWVCARTYPHVNVQKKILSPDLGDGLSPYEFSLAERAMFPVCV
jgi:hypothetical protein